MVSGQPPSSRPPMDERLTAARGTLRDALGGLHNLQQLARSIRVGPRALAAVLPDVHASCKTMRSSAAVLLDALPSVRAASMLRAYADPKITALEKSLAAARRRRMTAKHRLALENDVTHLSHELDAVRELIDLLAEAAWGVRVRVHLAELVRETFTLPDAKELRGHRVFPVALAPAADDREVLVNPRVAMSLLSIGAVAVSTAHPSQVPWVVMGASPRGASVTIAPEAPQVTTHGILARDPIEPTRACAGAAADLAGVELEHADDGSRYTLAWPPSPS
jgi:hypothetical protein